MGMVLACRAADILLRAALLPAAATAYARVGRARLRAIVCDGDDKSTCGRSARVAGQRRDAMRRAGSDSDMDQRERAEGTDLAERRWRQRTKRRRGTKLGKVVVATTMMQTKCTLFLPWQTASSSLAHGDMPPASFLSLHSALHTDRALTDALPEERRGGQGRRGRQVCCSIPDQSATLERLELDVGGTAFVVRATTAAATAVCAIEKLADDAYSWLSGYLGGAGFGYGQWVRCECRCCEWQ